MRVLIVRLSSMGDVVHTLPALTDAARAHPHIRFDWAVDESFADIPAWHSNVDQVFPVSLRRWRKDLASSSGRTDLNSVLKNLRSRRYDAIIDLQGEFKSAFVARLAKGPKHGYDSKSARERGAQVVYGKRYAVPKGTHSMTRMRQLMSSALSFQYDKDVVDYGIERERLPGASLKTNRPYVLFIHSTSWDSKNWPEHYWIDLLNHSTVAGFQVILTWGNEAERDRALRIADRNPNAVVLPPLSIAQKASIISGAVATVGLDTGLSHIAAALGVPSVTLYGATDPKLCGTIGKNQLQIKSEFECVGCHETDCSFADSSFKPACFESVKPAKVWSQLEQLLADSVESKRSLHIA